MIVFHGVHGAHAAHAVAAKERAKVLDAFRVRGATAPDRAKPLGELGLSSDDRQLGAFIASGVIRGVDTRGRASVIGDTVNRVAGYYLDEAAWVAQRDRAAIDPRKRAVLLLLALVLAILGALLAGMIVSQSR
jgi:hypothetical protein